MESLTNLFEVSGLISEYWTQERPGLEDKFEVIGGPVHPDENPDEIIGTIVDYNNKTGMMKVRLFEPVSSVELLKRGIPLEHITLFLN